jgi:hypothetical protein
MRFPSFAGCLIRAVLGLVLLAGVSGCTVSTRTRGGTLTLEPAAGRQDVEQSFAEGFITRGNAGEYDVVMVNNAVNWESGRSRPNKPLQPTPLAPIRQVLCIHMYWRPLAGTTRNPAAINASINWYVLGPDGSNEILSYEGAGYVSLRGSPDKRTIIIRDGKLRPKSDAGNLHDPIGPASISGRFVAMTNDTRVRETLDDVQKRDR